MTDAVRVMPSFEGNIFFKTFSGYKAHLKVFGESGNDVVEKLQYLDGYLSEHGMMPEKHNSKTPATSGTPPPPKPEPAPKSTEGTLVDAVVKELDASIVPTEPGDEGIEHVTRIDIIPQQDEKVNVEFYGPWGDKEIGDYPALKIYNWGYETIGRLLGWGTEYFKEPKSYSGSWTATYALGKKKNKVGNYYKNIKSVVEREQTGE